MEAVSDAEAFRAMHVMAQMDGISMEPAAAVACAGFLKMVNEQIIQPDEVVVMVRGNEVVKKTILGDIDSVVVEPIMEFSGLYDKRGDTVIWYSNDECRVPVKVRSWCVPPMSSVSSSLTIFMTCCPGVRLDMTS